MTALAIALILDTLFGEPRLLWERWPHPAALAGRGVAALDAWLNRDEGRQARGILAVAILVLGAGVLGWLLAWLPGGLAEIVVLAVLLAQRSLVDHVTGVAHALNISLASGRIAVARIVGRDTAPMGEAAVARAAIESAAENLSDGVVAPVFWFVVAGLPGLLVYKVVNTADSMIGYRTPRHKDFGWAAARLDDLLNLIPARLTALMIWLISPQLWGQSGQWRRMSADARRHASPNAGWPEAVMARALGVALSGPRACHGQMQDMTYVNHTGQRDIGAAEVGAAVRVLWQVWALVLAIAVVASLL